MNHPLDPKHAENENMFEENNLSNSIEKEEQSSPIENQEEVEVFNPVQEEAPSDGKSETITNPDNAPELVTEIVVEENLLPVEEDEPDNSPESEEKEETTANTGSTIQSENLSKEQIIEHLNALVEMPMSDDNKVKIETLKQSFYKHRKIEIEDARKIFISEGGDKDDFIVPEDELEQKLKENLNRFREKKAFIAIENEKQKEENLKIKQAIIEELKVLIESQDDFYKVYNEFRKLQQQWKDVKQVPQANVNELWKAYQHYSEKFYDLLKINNEMRDYDFKKNLELKTSLCEAAERLSEEKDIISAFYQLQKLHQEWREIGPVAKELREEIWQRFKGASSEVNKKHQDHFEALRTLELRNLEEKTAICEKMEAINYDQLKSFKDWDEQNKQVLDLQEKWKSIGFAPRKYNVKIFERFRNDCDLFFQKKSEFYKSVKESMDVNYEKKKELCEKVEEIKDSQDWKETTDKFIALQKEWKTIGPVPRKYSDTIWNRFISACDYFFEQKNTHFSSQKTEEIENLRLKKELIARISEIDEKISSADAVSQVREIMSEWNSIGFVPFREKDKIYKEYREAVDKQFERLKMDQSERRLQSFKSNMDEIVNVGEKSKNKLLSERERLMRTYEHLKNDIQTYENNIGFLSVSSKGGGGLLKEMNHKIDSLKEEFSLIIKKIEVIDENLGFEK